MKTISQAVSEYIKSKPFLSSALSDGIINFTSLSRKIKPDIEELLRKKVNNGAIVMALNRLSINLEFQHTQKIKRVIKKIQEITVRSNLFLSKLPANFPPTFPRPINPIFITFFFKETINLNININLIF